MQCASRMTGLGACRCITCGWRSTSCAAHRTLTRPWGGSVSRKTVRARRSTESHITLRGGGLPALAWRMIIDPRYHDLAQGLTGFSIELKKGERVLIDAFDVPDAMVIALIRAVRERGAHPS